MKKFFEEFRSFAMKGNVVDLAVGVIIGASVPKYCKLFGKRHCFTCFGAFYANGFFVPCVKYPWCSDKIRFVYNSYYQLYSNGICGILDGSSDKQN